MEENDEEEKEPTNIELTEQKTDPYNDENAIDFRWSDAKEEEEEEDEEDIALTSFSEKLAKAIRWGNFSKKSNWMIVVLYQMKRKIKKSFLEVISNSKILYIKIFQWSCQRPRFCQTYKGTGQRRIR